jgi:diguanylate cyclase (GGDEF)-like protein
MVIDAVSLFIASGICAGALALTMLSVWSNNRSDHFMVGWTVGMMLLGIGVVLYHSLPPERLNIVATAFTLEIIGFVIIYIAARQFTGKPTGRRLVLFLALAVPPVGIPILIGFDGIGIMIFNFLTGALLTATAMRYLATRSEAPSAITAMTVLYALAALSFFACGTIIAHERTWVLDGRPDNWAEQFNAIACIAGITGIGALSLGLNNARAARRHREEARTDALTGLLNRRALFDTFSGKLMSAGQAVVAFDLDRFKLVNDQYGHAVGDQMLKNFACALRQNLREGDLAARTGGEELVLVLQNASSQIASSTAERIRAIFAECHIDTAIGRLAGTASAGVAVANGQSFEEVLHRADTSLYRAKDGGRDCVVTALHAA